MPVHEGSVWILLPCPDMQRVERGQAEAVRRLEEMEQLSHQFRRGRVLRVPGVGEHQVIGARQPQVAIRHRLIYDDLRARGIDYSFVHQFAVHIMKAHGALIGAAHASELQGIALRLGYRDILKALGRVTNDLDQGSRLALVFLLRVRVVLRSGAPRTDADHKQGHHGVPVSRREFLHRSLLTNHEIKEKRRTRDEGASAEPIRNPLYWRYRKRRGKDDTV